MRRLTLEEALGCVGPGWHPIVRDLYEDLVELGWDRNLYQVKEKFGGLRFYIGEGTEKIWSRITKAEIDSEQTCEECGAPGTIGGKWWLKCLCKECRGKIKSE